MEPAEIAEIASLFKAFSDATRVRILLSLFERERSVGEVVSMVGATQTAVSHQLATLKRAHLVTARREGKNIYYSLADRHIKIIIDMATEHIKE